MARMGTGERRLAGSRGMGMMIEGTCKSVRVTAQSQVPCIVFDTKYCTFVSKISFKRYRGSQTELHKPPSL